MIATGIEHLEQVLNEFLAQEWEAQGHKMTGAVVDAIEYTTKQEGSMLILSGLMYPYANIIAAGVKANKIPYSGRTGAGGTSLYIQALQSYAQQRMNINDEKQSLRVAFAIAESQRKEGMPTSGSYKYSSTGKRLEWVEEAFRKGEERIAEAVRDFAYNAISVNLDVILNKWQIELNKN